jgi:hypothetical protein
MGMPADFWIVLAAIAAWSAILLVIALFADNAAKFSGPGLLWRKLSWRKLSRRKFSWARFGGVKPPRR